MANYERYVGKLDIDPRVQAAEIISPKPKRTWRDYLGRALQGAAAGMSAPSGISNETGLEVGGGIIRGIKGLGAMSEKDAARELLMQQEEKEIADKMAMERYQQQLKYSPETIAGETAKTEAEAKAKLPYQKSLMDYQATKAIQRAKDIDAATKDVPPATLASLQKQAYDAVFVMPRSFIQDPQELQRLDDLVQDIYLQKVKAVRSPGARPAAQVKPSPTGEIRIRNKKTGEIARGPAGSAIPADWEMIP